MTVKYGQLSERASAGSRVALFNAAIRAQKSGDDAGGICGDHAGEVNDPAHGPCRDIIAAEWRRRGKLDGELVEAGFNSVRHRNFSLAKLGDTLAWFV